MPFPDEELQKRLQFESVSCVEERKGTFEICRRNLSQHLHDEHRLFFLQKGLNDLFSMF
jgi:hypothetical protein